MRWQRTERLTETTRRQYRRKDLRYARDVTDAGWALIEPHLPAPKRLGSPRCVRLRAVVEALLYLLRTASPWRLLPRNFPNRSTVQRYFCAWQAAGVWETLNVLLLPQAGERRTRSQSVGWGDRQPIRQDDGKRGSARL
jgi:transposase